MTQNQERSDLLSLGGGGEEEEAIMLFSPQNTSACILRTPK